jgi:nucleotide-binding universal stress UspA family protein
MMVTPIGLGRELVQLDQPSAPFKRLLVPLDGSPLAERALPFAQAMSRIVDGDLILVRATNVKGAYLDLAEAQVRAATEAEHYLKEVADRYGTCHPVEYSVPYGDPAAAVAGVAQTRAADLIVMTTHGRGELARMVVGSVADAVVRETRVPLLLIRAGLEIDAWEQGLHRILVPLDGSALAEAALPRVAELARLTNARLTLLQVIGPPMPELTAFEIARLPEDDGELTIAAEAYLRRVAATLHERGLDADTAVHFGDPAACIAEEVALNRHGLVAMSTHGRSGIDRLVVGSVADRVLRTARAPLLLFRGE